MAFTLQLHEEYTGSDLPVAEVETRRRLMWACFCLDTIVMEKTHAIETIGPASINVRLPMNERGFGLSIPSTTSIYTLPLGPLPQRAVTPDDEGILAQFVKLMAVRRHLLHQLGGSSLSSNVFSFDEDLHGDLKHWRNHLPPELELTRTNVWARSSRGQLSQLCASKRSTLNVKGVHF